MSTSVFKSPGLGIKKVEIVHVLDASGSPRIKRFRIVTSVRAALCEHLRRWRLTTRGPRTKCSVELFKYNDYVMTHCIDKL